MLYRPVAFADARMSFSSEIDLSPNKKLQPTLSCKLHRRSGKQQPLECQAGGLESSNLLSPRLEVWEATTSGASGSRSGMQHPLQSKAGCLVGNNLVSARQKVWRTKKVWKAEGLGGSNLVSASLVFQARHTKAPPRSTSFVACCQVTPRRCAQKSGPQVVHFHGHGYRF